MDLEVGQLVQRYAALRVIDRDRVSRLAASIARNGQQSPVIVVGERVLVDGYHRVAALPIAEDEGSSWPIAWRRHGGAPRSKMAGCCRS